MTIRVKAVIITSRLGASDSTVTSAVSWTMPRGRAGLARRAEVDVDRLRVAVAGSRSMQVAAIGITTADAKLPSILGRSFMGRDPAHDDILRAAGQQKHLPLTALHQMQAAATVQRYRFLNSQQLACPRTEPVSSHPNQPSCERHEGKHQEQGTGAGDDGSHTGAHPAGRRLSASISVSTVPRRPIRSGSVARASGGGRWSARVQSRSIRASIPVRSTALP